MASGGNVTAGYFELMSQQISEFIMITEAWFAVAKMKADSRSKSASGSGAQSLGSLEGMEWEDQL